MSGTTTTYDFSGTLFDDSTVLSGTWTASYDATGQISSVSNASVIATGPGGTTVLTDAYPLSYANPTPDGDYEITFAAAAGGAYSSLYLDYTSELPTHFNSGTATPYTSIRNGGSAPIPLSISGAITESVACFARGTLIETPSGEVQVETIQAGAHVSLARGGIARVKWVGHRRLRPAASRDPASVQPIAVAPGAFGDGLPRRELRLSPEHAVFIGGLLVPVGLLVNGRSIVPLDVDTVEYFHVELDAHDVILAEGAPVESYFDTGNRSIFANTPLVTLRPGFEPTIPCAEMMFDGAWLGSLRARLASIADTDGAVERVTA